MVAYGRGGGRTERARSVFPCGHAVCAACDDKLQARRFFACPMCRTPREGFSREEVDLAAQARAIADATADGSGIAGWEVQIQTNDAATFEDFLRSRAQQPQQQPPASGSGGGWRVMFFANESNGDPFDVLRRAARDAVPHGGRASRRRRVRHSERERDGEEQEEEEGAREAAAATSPDVRFSPLLSEGLRDLIANHLLRPTSLQSFLARHSEVTRPN